MPLSQVLIDGKNWELVTEGLQFADGLCADAEGNLYFSDVKGGKAVYRIFADGDQVEEFIAKAPGISGLKWGSNGRLYACIAAQGRVVSYSEKGEEEELAGEVRPNDLVVTHEGNVYFTMTPTGEVRRIDPEGNLSVVSQGVVKRPNGITLSPDQGTLAVSEHGGKHVWVFRIEADGTLSNPEPYMTMRTPASDPEVAKGDGMTTDVHGRYYVTSAEGIQVFDPTGRMSGVIAKPEEAPVVSVAFAGPEHRYLYVANGGKIFRRKTLTQGALFFQKAEKRQPVPKG